MAGQNPKLLRRAVTANDASGYVEKAAAAPTPIRRRKRVIDGWTQASEIQPGDLIAMPGTFLTVRRIDLEGDELVVLGDPGQVRRYDPEDEVNIIRKVAKLYGPVYRRAESSRALANPTFTYFANKPDIAEGDGDLFEAQLSFNRPLDLRDWSRGRKEFEKALPLLPPDIQAHVKERWDQGYIMPEEWSVIFHSESNVEALQRAGYDGLIFPEKRGMAFRQAVFVCFNPSQVKRVRLAQEEFVTASAKLAKLHKYGCVMGDVPADSAAGKVVERLRGEVDDNDLMGDGKHVGVNHVTLRYGLIGDADVPAIKEYLEGLEPFEVSLGATFAFPPSKSSDGAAPIVMPCQADQLFEINTKLGEIANFKPADFDYKPHVTVAYVKPETADKYVGRRARSPQTFMLSRVQINVRLEDGDRDEYVELGAKPKKNRMEKLYERRPDLRDKTAASKVADGPAQDQDWMGKSGDITGTPTFKAWFSGSKVVDDHGRPLRVYHGTTHDFSEFKQGPNRTDAGYLGKGFYFSDDSNTANIYAGTSISEFRYGPPPKGLVGGRVMPVYLRMKRPLYVAAKFLTEGRHLPVEIDRTLTVKEALGLPPEATPEEITETAQSKGYDGIIYEYRSTREYVVFSPSQIKSAIGNSGEFNPKSNSITATVSEWKLYRGADGEEAGFHDNQDIWLALDPAYAERYSKNVSEYTLKPGTRILDGRTPEGLAVLKNIDERTTDGDHHKIALNPHDHNLPFYNCAYFLRYEAKQMGYDGAVFTEHVPGFGGLGVHSVCVWNSNKLVKVVSARHQASAIPEGVEFQEELTGTSGDQSNLVLRALVGGRVVAYVQYSEYHGEVSVQYIKTDPKDRRKGYATALLKKLQSMYPDTEINLGMTTDDGGKLVDSLKFNEQTTEHADKFTELQLLTAERDKLQAEADAFYEEWDRHSTQEREQFMQRMERLNEVNDHIWDLEQEVRWKTPTKRLIAQRTAAPGEYLDTPAFKAWFRNSKVVDASGHPLRVYHGTMAGDFESFNTVSAGDLGSHFGTEGTANGFAEREGGRVIPVYLAIQSPLRLPDLGRWTWETMKEPLKEVGINLVEKPKYEIETASMYENMMRHEKRTRNYIVQKIEEAGYDGIVYDNTHEGGGDSWIAFHPNQIKSAIANNGGYDANNTSITAAAPDFKTWFGDSLVTNPDGTPKLVYHGTRYQFDTLEPSKPHGAHGNPKGIYFTDNKREAEEFAMDVDGVQDERSRIISAYLRIQQDTDGIIRHKSYGDSFEYIVFDPSNVWVVSGGVSGPQLKQAAPATDTPAFKAWFGDSKIVDENGQPLKMYHGSKRDFDEFSDECFGTGTDTGYFGKGFYFTSAPGNASGYAMTQEDWTETAPGAQVYPVYLRVTNPYVITDYENEVGKPGGIDRAKALTEKWKSMGYDGVVYHGGTRFREVLVFDANQIKSAIGNNGQFDPEKASITAAATVTETPTFKAWFAGSKVVDRSGHPLRMFHGTAADFDEFSPEAVGRNFGDETGFYFTNNTTHDVAQYGDGTHRVWEDSTSAGGYAKNDARAQHGDETGARIMPVYLSVKNPMVIEEDTDGAGVLSLGETPVRGFGTLLQRAKKEGHDGIILRDTGTLIDGEPETVVAVISPNQIKSAISNNGQFDPQSSSITANATGVQDPFAGEDAMPSFDEVLNEIPRYDWKHNSLRTMKFLYQQIADIHDGPDPITVYRAIALKNGSESVRLDDIGDCWAWNEKSAKAYYPEDPYDPVFVFQGKVRVKDVDWWETVKRGMCNYEEEIRVQKGAQVELTGWREKDSNEWHAWHGQQMVTAAMKAAMNINVPESEHEHFWIEPPAGHEEFWALRFPPKAQAGDKITFRMNKQPVAEATISRIEKPGEHECEQTGRFKNRWKVYWAPKSFKDLRRTKQAAVAYDDLKEFAEDARNKIFGAGPARNGDCEPTSDALYDILKAHGYNPSIAYGFYRNAPHSWVQIEGTYIDPTHDQFGSPDIRTGKITDRSFKRDYQLNGLRCYAAQSKQPKQAAAQGALCDWLEETTNSVSSRALIAALSEHGQPILDILRNKWGVDVRARDARVPVRYIDADALKVSNLDTTRGEAHAQALAEKMRNGERFAPVVLADFGLIIDGYHRVRAAQIAGLKKIPCVHFSTFTKPWRGKKQAARPVSTTISGEYPKVLRNASEIASYIAEQSSSYVDEEYVEEYFQGCHAVLREVPVSEIHEGDADHNVPSKAKERRYLKLPLETMPPIVIEKGEIQDGNHRFRVAVAKGAQTVWCYDVTEGAPGGKKGAVVATKPTPQIPPVVYHSTNAQFEQFKNDGKLIFFANDAAWTKSWGKRTIAARIILNNPKVIENSGYHLEELRTKGYVRQLRKEGKDGVIVMNDGNPLMIYAVMSPSQIEIIDPNGGPGKHAANASETTASPDTNKIAVPRVPKELYHGTIRALLPEIEANGLQPRVGNYSQLWHSKVFDRRTGLERDVPPLTPVLFAASREHVIDCVLAIFAQLTSEQKKTHEAFFESAVLMVVPGESFQKAPSKRNKPIDLRHVESGDYFSTTTVHPTRVITGEELRAFLGPVYERARREWFGAHDPAASAQDELAALKQASVTIRAYHGTRAGDFDTFRPKYRKGEQLGFGTHFSTDKKLAERYAYDNATARKGKSPMVYTVNLHIENPLVADQIVKEGTPEFNLAKKLAGDRFWTQDDGTGKRCTFLQNMIDCASPQRAAKLIQEAGYDSVTYTAEVRSMSSPGHYHVHDQGDAYLVFDPAKIEIISKETLPEGQRPKFSAMKLSYVEEVPGHKNSEGESAPWCVKSHEDGHIISSHKTKGEAEEHLRQMEIHKHAAAVSEANIKKALAELDAARQAWIKSADDGPVDYDNCTECAQDIIDRVGTGSIYGYECENNPTAKLFDYPNDGGHDFAIIGEWLVDPWAASLRKTPAMLNLKKDHAKILDLYGDPRTWEKLVGGRFMNSAGSTAQRLAPGEEVPEQLSTAKHLGAADAPIVREFMKDGYRIRVVPDGDPRLSTKSGERGAGLYNRNTGDIFISQSTDDAPVGFFIIDHEIGHALYNQVQPVQWWSEFQSNPEAFREFADTSSAKSHCEGNPDDPREYDYVEAAADLHAERKMGRLNGKSALLKIMDNLLGVASKRASLDPVTWCFPNRAQGIKVADVDIPKDVFVDALNELNEVLKEKDEHLTFLCVGGGAMMLVYGTRDKTQDIDGIIAPPTQENKKLFHDCAREAAERVSDSGRFQLPEEWINIQVKNIMGGQGYKMSYFEPDPRYTWSNLTVLFAKPAYLLGMKCQAMREGRKDFKDIESLCKVLQIRSIDDLIEAISPYVDPNYIGNDEYPTLKFVIASAFPGETEYEPLRKKVLQRWQQVKPRG